MKVYRVRLPNDVVAKVVPINRPNQPVVIAQSKQAYDLLAWTYEGLKDTPVMGLSEFTAFAKTDPVLAKVRNWDALWPK